MTDWQSKGTAPRDGTQILVLCGDDECVPWQMVVSYELTEYPSWHWIDHEGRAYHENLIMKWQPLPPPPETK